MAVLKLLAGFVLFYGALWYFNELGAILAFVLFMAGVFLAAQGIVDLGNKIGDGGGW